MERTQQGWTEQVGVAYRNYASFVGGNGGARQQRSGKSFLGLSVIEVAVQRVVVDKRMVDSDAKLVTGNDLAARSSIVREEVRHHVEVRQGVEGFEISQGLLIQRQLDHVVGERIPDNAGS